MVEWQEYLVKLVEKHPCLWNKKHPDYHYRDSKIDKHEIWLNISTEMENFLGIKFPEAECKKKWINLKDTFHQHRKTYEAKLDSGVHMQPKWKWWPLFHFMLKPTQENHDDATFDSLCEPIDSITLPTIPPPSSSLSTPVITIVPSDPLKEQSFKKSEKKRITKRKLSGDTVPVLNTKLSYTETDVSSMRCSEKRDEAYYFALSLVEKFRRLNDYQFALCRKEIENLMFDIQYNSSDQAGSTGIQPSSSALEVKSKCSLQNVEL